MKGAWHLRRVPFLAMMSAVVMIGVLVMVTVSVATREPWLGFTLVEQTSHDSAGNGVVVESVAAEGPAATQLKPGDRILAIAGDTGSWELLQSTDTMREPDTLGVFSAYNAFMARHAVLWQVQSSSVVRLRLDSGRVVQVRPVTARPWTDLSVNFWLLALFGTVSCLITAAVWSSSSGIKNRTPVQLLALSGIGFMVTAFSVATYTQREIAMNPAWFQSLEMINYAAVTVFGVAGAALLWCYPIRLTRFPLQWFMLAAGGLVWFNRLFQWHDIPIHSIYLSQFVTYLFAIALSVVQWKKTRADALARAALKWIVLSIFMPTGVALLLFFVPPVFGVEPLVSNMAAAGLGLLMFIGLAAGVARYRLFSLEEWWFDIWLWFSAGLTVIGMDALFVFVMGIIPLRAFGLAIIIVGWFYIPLRGRLWALIRSDSEGWWKHYLPNTLEQVFAAPNKAAFLQRWHLFLRRTFRPLDVVITDSQPTYTQVLDNGVRMRVPPLGEGTAYDLVHNQRGTRLFTRKDAHLADTFSALAARTLQAFEAREQGVQGERQRIMRDLHDDVGASLLTLARRCRDPRNSSLASQALDTLRDVVHSLSLDAERTLDEAITDYRGEAVERCEGAGVQFLWRVDGALPQLPLSGRQYVHLRRILREAVSNIVKHARAGRAEFNVTYNQGQLHVEIVNNGVLSKTVGVGSGLNNMRSRALELGGSLDWHVDTEQFVLQVSVPVAEAMNYATRITR